MSNCCLLIETIESFYEGLENTTKPIDKEKLEINANIFQDILIKSLENYCAELKKNEWDSDIWKNLRKKMKSIIENCKTS